jgi:hypothetical protein
LVVVFCKATQCLKDGGHLQFLFEPTFNKINKKIKCLKCKFWVIFIFNNDIVFFLLLLLLVKVSI